MPDYELISDEQAEEWLKEDLAYAEQNLAAFDLIKERERLEYVEEIKELREALAEHQAGS